MTFPHDCHIRARTFRNQTRLLLSSLPKNSFLYHSILIILFPFSYSFSIHFFSYFVPFIYQSFLYFVSKSSHYYSFHLIFSLLLISSHFFHYYSFHLISTFSFSVRFQDLRIKIVLVYLLQCYMLICYVIRIRLLTSIFSLTCRFHNWLLPSTKITPQRSLLGHPDTQ